MKFQNVCNMRAFCFRRTKGNIKYIKSIRSSGNKNKIKVEVEQVEK